MDMRIYYLKYFTSTGWGAKLPHLMTLVGSIRSDLPIKHSDIFA